MNSCCPRLTTQKVLVVATVILLGAATASAQGKTPVPDAAAQKQARQLIRDLYGKERDAAKTSAEKTALAQKLLDQAAKSKGDPASHFVLLETAKEVAVEAADIETALEAVERIVGTYDVDPIEMKLDCLQALARTAKVSSQREALAEAAFSLIDTAVAEDDFEAAARFGEIARDAARIAREFSLLKEIVAGMKEVDELEQAHAEYKKALALLEDNPTDPRANLAVGRYLCLAKGDWEQGIPMLALGSDPALKAVAVKELRAATSPEAQVALADAWWDLAETKAGGERDALLLHAGSWYRKAQAQLSGLVRAKVDQRLAEIAKVAKPPRVVSAASRPRSNIPEGAVLALTFEKDSFFQDAERVCVRDVSGHSNDGVIHGGRPAPGRAGQGFLLAGPEDYIDCGNAESLDPTDSVTVSAWIMGRRWKATDRNRNDLVSNDDWEGGLAKGYVLRCDQEGKPDFNVGNRVWRGALSEQAMQAGQWYHLVGRYDRHAVSMFVNGVEVASTESSMPIQPSSSALIIGRGTYDTVRRFDGIIDEVAVFNRALSDDEIKALFQLGLRGKTLAP